MERGLLRSGADAEEGTLAAFQIMPEILTPAHGLLEHLTVAGGQDPLRAETVIYRGGEDVLDFLLKFQACF